MEKQLHYRLYNLKKNRVEIQFYVHPGSTVKSSFREAAEMAGITLLGRYRLERMVKIHGRLTWLRGMTVIITPV